ncbi:hypothetical protein [Mycolicibacterium mageritense]|uniref:hypothetical protein n=1 Tax=Mycolicibacterium mageritense TaxID=53462 RepID=UPI0011D7149C|nr:hypothetical protein [Mycolicibacterium mageritense]TXI53505.1 MAG: hypothetical protein E6Q55_35055 [Mycolicibacterium mageritense]
MTTPALFPTVATPQPTRPPRLQVAWRRMRLSVRRDPLAAVTSPAAAIQLVDSMLARTAVGRCDYEIWCSVAVAPLAALLAAGSPVGHGAGISWVRHTVADLHTTGTSAAAWDNAENATRQLPSDVLRAALPRWRGFPPRQRQTITRVITEALHL